MSRNHLTRRVGRVRAVVIGGAAAGSLALATAFGLQVAAGDSSTASDSEQHHGQPRAAATRRRARQGRRATTARAWSAGRAATPAPAVRPRRVRDVRRHPRRPRLGALDQPLPDRGHRRRPARRRARDRRRAAGRGGGRGQPVPSGQRGAEPPGRLERPVPDAGRPGPRGTDRRLAERRSGRPDGRRDAGRARLRPHARGAYGPTAGRGSPSYPPCAAGGASAWTAPGCSGPRTCSSTSAPPPRRSLPTAPRPR